MIKLNLLNYSTWKGIMEDLYKPIRMEEKPSDMLDEF